MSQFEIPTTPASSIAQVAELVLHTGPRVNHFEEKAAFAAAVNLESLPTPEAPASDVIQKAVAKDRERRFNTAHTLVRALEDVTTAALLVVDEDDGPRVMLQKRSAMAHEGGTWSCAGGALDQGELPIDGAMREAAEEVGEIPAPCRVRGE
mgnify:CR=1 FL=1